MRKNGKNRLLAGVLSFLLVVTSVLTGNVGTVRADGEEGASTVTFGLRVDPKDMVSSVSYQINGGDSVVIELEDLGLQEDGSGTWTSETAIAVGSVVSFTVTTVEGCVIDEENSVNSVTVAAEGNNECQIFIIPPSNDCTFSSDYTVSAFAEYDNVNVTSGTLTIADTLRICQSLTVSGGSVVGSGDNPVIEIEPGAEVTGLTLYSGETTFDNPHRNPPANNAREVFDWDGTKWVLHVEPAGDGDGGDGGSSNDVTYNESVTISSNITKNKITISGTDEAPVTVTIGQGQRVRADVLLTVGSNANLVGTDQSSMIEVPNGGARVSGIPLYDTDGTTLVSESNNYTNNSSGPVEFEWDSTASKWKKHSNDPSGGTQNNVTYSENSSITSDVTANNVTISGSGTAVVIGAGKRIRVDGTLAVGDGTTLKGTDHTSILELGGNASVTGMDLYNASGTSISNSSHSYTNSGSSPEEFEWDSTGTRWKKRTNSGGGTPSTQNYSVNFGATGTWTIGEATVSAKDSSSQAITGTVTIAENDQITLTNFNNETMEVIVSASDGFNVELAVSNGKTSLANRDANKNFPAEASLTFTVRAKSAGGQGGGQGGGQAGNPTVEVDSNGYPAIEGANVFVDVVQTGFIGNLTFNTRGVVFTSDGTKGAANATLADAPAKIDVSLQIEFGKAVSKVTINGVEYSGDNLVDQGEDTYNFSIDRAENNHYSFSFVEAASTVSTIVWTYDANDPNGPQGDTYSTDALVQHGKVEIVSIKRGENTLYSNGAYASGVQPQSDKVSVDIGGQRGYVRLEKGDDIVIKLIPDYGYQLTTASINDRTLTPVSNNFSDVSTFKLDNVQGQMHFSGVFSAKSDVITTPATNVSSATITNGANAASSGNLSLDVANGSADANALAAATGSDMNSTYTTAATLDITLTNVVSQGTEGNNWTNQVTEFTNPITVGLNLTGIDVSEGEELIVVRKHDDQYDTISASSLNNGVLSVPTNKFSTYSIIKKKAKTSIANATITLGDALTYDGSAQTQDVASVKIGDTTLTVDTDYEITGAQKTEAGTYTLTVTGKGDYKGTKTATFTIAKKALTASVSGTITKTYDGKKTVSGTPTISLSGVIGSDVVTATASKYEYASVNVGTDISVTATGITLSGAAAGNYSLSSTTATGTGAITKATPTITLGNLNQTTNALGAVTATLSPASSDATVTIKYEVVTTPYKAAVAAKPCKYASGHLASCAKKAEGVEDESTVECTCGYHTEAHTTACGYAAAQAEVAEVKSWVTDRPTTVGTYNVQAYLTSENAGTNLNAVGTSESPAATGVLKITQYVAPASTDTGNDSSSDSSNDSGSTDTNTTTTTQPAKTTSKLTTTTPAATTPSQSLLTKPEVKAEDVKPTVLVESKEVKASVAEGDDKAVVDVQLSGSSEEAWKAATTAIADTIAEVAAATPDKPVEVSIALTETTEIPVEIFETIKGKDVELTLEMGDGIAWVVNGQDIGNVDFTSINLEVKVGEGAVTEDMILTVAANGEETVKLSLTHDGEFGFTANLEIDLDQANAGKYANLYYLNETTNELEFMGYGRIGLNGKAQLEYSHASDYVIVIAEAPAVTEVAEKAENAAVDTAVSVTSATATSKTNVIVIIVVIILLLGVIAAFVVTNKKKSE